MPHERIDPLRALMPSREPRSMTTALVVGEFLTLRVRVGGVDLLFGLEAKATAKEALKALSVDNVKIVLTIGSESGQRARVRVQAPDTVRILKPEKAAG